MLLNKRTEYYFNKYSEDYDQQIEMLDTVLEAAKGQGYQVDTDTGKVIRVKKKAGRNDQPFLYMPA